MLARVEAERYRVAGPVSGRTNVDVVSLSLVFPFGRSERAAPRAAMPMMMPMAAAPAPAPVAAPAPAPMPPPVVIVQAAPQPAVVVVPERRRVSFEAESLFGFDNASVRDTGKVALDDFARQLDGTRFETITVEGHTDRLGSTAYNQKLSQERADAVKTYLVTAGRVDPAKISAAGKGESMPVSKPEDCKGQAATAKLIACLQPDRRVEIEVAGTR
jgi:OmpA-OmpF porin, OOP family